MNQITDTSSFALLAGEAGFDPIEERLRTNVRATIEAVFEEELASFLGRLRYDRGDGPAKGYRHGHRERQLTGTFSSSERSFLRPISTSVKRPSTRASVAAANASMALRFATSPSPERPCRAVEARS